MLSPYHYHQVVAGRNKPQAVLYLDFELYLLYHQLNMNVKRVRGALKATIAILLSAGTLFTCYVSTNLPNSNQFTNGLSWLRRNAATSERKERLLCVIITMPANHGSKAKAVRDTWFKRCDLSLFFTTRSDPAVFPNASAVVLNVSEGRWSLWEKTRSAFMHIHRHYGDQFDWFLKSDDDTYFIIENLRLFLSGHNPNDRIWLGCELVVPGTQQHFLSGGAGYVLSRAALTAFADTVQGEIANSTLDNVTNHEATNSTSPAIIGCGQGEGAMGEDVRLALCLRRAGVRLVDGQGENEPYRFLPTLLEHFVFPERNGGNGWVASYGKHKQGINACCHERLISIHYASPKLMYTFEFLIYHLKVENATSLGNKR